jgi:hypothetical protein
LSVGLTTQQTATVAKREAFGDIFREITGGAVGVTLV